MSITQIHIRDRKKIEAAKMAELQDVIDHRIMHLLKHIRAGNAEGAERIINSCLAPDIADLVKFAERQFAQRSDELEEMAVKYDELPKCWDTYPK